MEVHWRNPRKLSEPDQEYAIGRLQDSNAGHGDLTDVWIDAARGSRHHQKRDERVSIRCLVRHASVVAVASAADVGAALRSALEKSEGEMGRLRSRRSEHRARHQSGPQLIGIVDRVIREEDYGFLLTDGGEQVYFHRNSLHGDLDFDQLEEGQQVALNYYAGEMGPQASVVGRVANPRGARHDSHGLNVEAGESEHV